MNKFQTKPVSMGKRGPCYHCGIDNTPLWRNGPPGKPVLCNACGSRWRTKGTLANYIPKHTNCCRVTRSKRTQKSKQYKIPLEERLISVPILVDNGGRPKFEESDARNDLYSAGREDERHYRSSSESAISCSESCIPPGRMDGNGNEISGSIQSSIWNSRIPSRKRSVVRRRSLSPIERLRRDLYKIHQDQILSNLSECPEEVLIFSKNNQISSNEIGLGSVLLKSPISSTKEESQTSSLTMENKVSCLNDGTDHMGSSSYVFDPLQIKDSPQVRTTSKPSNEEGYESLKRICRLCSSGHLGGEISFSDKGTPDSPIIQTLEGFDIQLYSL